MLMHDLISCTMHAHVHIVSACTHAPNAPSRISAQERRGETTTPLTHHGTGEGDIGGAEHASATAEEGDRGSRAVWVHRGIRGCAPG